MRKINKKFLKQFLKSIKNEEWQTFSKREDSRVYTYNARETILKVNDAFINLHQWSQKYVKYDTVA